MLNEDEDEVKKEDEDGHETNGPEHHGNDDTFEMIDEDELNSISLETVGGTPQPVVMEYAEREHRKWLHPDVALVNNPYSPENIEQRARQMHSITPTTDVGGGDDETSPEDDISEEEKRKLFYSDRDITKYKRDYYLPKDRPKEGVVFDILDVSWSAMFMCLAILMSFIITTVTQQQTIKPKWHGGGDGHKDSAKPTGA